MKKLLNKTKKWKKKLNNLKRKLNKSLNKSWIRNEINN